MIFILNRKSSHWYSGKLKSKMTEQKENIKVGREGSGGNEKEMGKLRKIYCMKDYKNGVNAMISNYIIWNLHVKIKVFVIE